ncbi:MAG: LuxR C-terminal-related transcriptional regulator [Bacteroidota bacterium]
MKNTDHNLTKRELEIMQLISEGFTNIQIAQQLYVSSETISKQRKTLMRKLNLKNTALLMRFAFTNQLIK